MIYEIFMPKLTHDMQTGILVAWVKKENDLVKKGDVLFEVETDKAISEVEAEDEGYLRGISVEDGQEVKVGEVIAYLTSDETEPLPAGSGSQPTDEAPEQPEAVAGEPVMKKEDPSPDSVSPDSVSPDSLERIFISPIARRMAEESQIDIHKVPGSGPRGRIIERDITAVLAARAATKPGKLANTVAYQDRRMSRANQVMAARMVESVQTIPQFVVEMAVRLDEVLRYKAIWQEQHQKKLSLTAILIRAVSQVLGGFPLLNASVIEPETIRVYEDINIGIAFQTAESLLVPVVHNAPARSMFEIMTIMDQFRMVASERGFQPEDLALGTFTISNLGMYGVERFTALINPPQTAILAVGSSHDQLVRTDKGFGFCSAIALRLSTDHRVITGVYASQFLTALRELLENPKTLILQEVDQR